MVRLYSFSHRRQNPDMFPEACDTCSPVRRFMLPAHKQRHDDAKHSAQSPLYDVSKSFLESFVRDTLEPDTDYNTSCCAVVNRLCNIMKHNFHQELRPAQIIKGGSLGKGTAVKGKSDVDLVVFLPFDSIRSLQNKMDTVLNDMKTYLHGGECTIEGQTQHAVKVSVSCHQAHTHDVDILPSVNILDKYHSKEEIYERMKGLSETDQSFYSAALVPLQIDFVSQRPTKLKSLIRLVKYWRKTSFNESTGDKRLPTSYPLEVITISQWLKECGRENFDLRQGFYNVLKALVNYP
ncbi:2'-5'-oligoadenylate synthetase [Mytilus galloprovincialis]|uniref:2'-5'-oligoadenylate synthetase n=1 Tax=Mytilus galloprovincialis TaxID=29158 RepID=A0A8B6CL07_MYTGA|nr:2'-5'-oligoadenylate synthetase [Mytilus galloprovincialis]